MEDILQNNNGNTNPQPPVSTPLTNNNQPISAPDVTNQSLPQNPDEFLVKEAPPHGLDSSWRRWKCLVCGYVYEGLYTGKMVCPKCGNSDPDKFDEAE